MNQDIRMKLYFSRSLAVAALALAVVIAPVKSQAKEPNTYELLELFGDVFDRVRSEYVEPVKDKELIETALNGMLSALDPHSGYLNAKSFREMQVQTKGEFGGLGIEVTMENGLVKVVSPIDGTPAARAGLQPNDYVSQIDETPVMGLNLSQAVEMMRGRVGSKIALTILREGEKEPLKVALVRETIRIQSVRAHAEDDIAYIRLVSFAESTYPNLKKEMKKLKKEIGAKLKGVVLDVRNNPGGLLDQAIAVSDAFLPRGEIVSTRSRNPRESRRYTASAGDLADGLPIVVLINGGSASASEIVAGALKDHKRAIVMGTKSFGKGSVQTVIPVKNKAAIRLTTARYYTPSGETIQAKGIEPDIVVEQAKIEALKNNRRYSEAQLPNHLLNGQEKPGDLKKKSLKKTDKKASGKDSKSTAKNDYQLSRALDLIRAVSIYNNVHEPKKQAANASGFTVY
jgi:carboxyl-terminal processing protease